MKILKLSFLILLIALILALVVLLWYLPGYLLNKQTLEITPVGDTKIMSYNLRCIAPEDLGHQSWFYRAPLVLEDIEAQKPGQLHRGPLIPIPGLLPQGLLLLQKLPAVLFGQLRQLPFVAPPGHGQLHLPARPGA